MIKVITRMGLVLMEPKVREERLDALMDGAAIDGPAVARLIDDCRDACYALAGRDSEKVSTQQKIQIRWMLTRIKGEDVVRNMDPDELAEWVLDLRKNKTAFSASDLGTVAKALMGME